MMLMIATMVILVMLMIGLMIVKIALNNSNDNDDDGISGGCVYNEGDNPANGSDIDDDGGNEDDGVGNDTVNYDGGGESNDGDVKDRDDGVGSDGVNGYIDEDSMSNGGCSRMTMFSDGGDDKYDSDGGYDNDCIGGVNSGVRADSVSGNGGGYFDESIGYGG